MPTATNEQYWDIIRMAKKEMLDDLQQEIEEEAILLSDAIELIKKHKKELSQPTKQH